MAKAPPVSVWEGSRRFRLDLTGLTGLLFNNPTGGPATRQVDPAQWEHDHFAQLAYYHDGRLCLPEPNLRKCLMNGANQSTLKPPGRLRSFGPILGNALVVLEPAIIDRAPDELIRHVTTVIIGKARIKRTRPLLPPPWKATTTCEVFDERLTRDVLAEVGTKAGRFVGICERATPWFFGRFTVDVSEV